MVYKVRHVVILGVHRDDAFSDAKSDLIGQTGDLEVTRVRKGHYVGGRFTPDRPISVYGEPENQGNFTFYKVRVKNCPKEE